MSNPPKQKGTGFETERERRWQALGLRSRKMPNGSHYDVHVEGREGLVVEALTMRPDRKQAYTLIRTSDFEDLVVLTGATVHEECKRPARLSISTTFEKKFG